MFEAVVVLEFDQTANLGAEKGHGLWTNPSGADVDLEPGTGVPGRPWGCQPALRKWLMRWSMGGCGVGSGGLR